MKNLRLDKIGLIHKTALSILGFQFEYDNVMYILDHLPMVKPDTVGSVYGSISGSVGSKNYNDAVSLLEKNLNTVIDIENGSASSFSTINHVEIIVATYILIIENSHIFDCMSPLLTGSDGNSYSLNDMIARFNITSSVGFMFKDHYKSFCSDPSRWIINITGHDRFFLPGSVKVGIFVDKKSVKPVSGSSTKKKKKKKSNCNGNYATCKEDFEGYFYETEGDHYTGTLPYTYDHHHGISVGDSNAVFEKWFQYSQTCGIDCCYPNFVKWYKKYKKIIGKFDPAKAIEILDQEISICSLGNDNTVKSPKITPPEFKFPRVTLPEVNIPSFEEEKKTPLPDSPLKDIEDILVTEKDDDKADCNWSLEEVRYLLQSLLTGNKPMLSAGSKETGGTYTEARHKDKILFFDVYKKLTGKNIRKLTEKYIEKLPVGGKGVKKFFSNLFSNPSRELISKVSDEVYSSLINYSKSPSTKRYHKYCDDNKDVQEMYNRAKVFMALQDLATGSFSASTETIMDSARSRRDITQQKELPMEETSGYMRRNSSIKSNIRQKRILKIYNSSK